MKNQNEKKWFDGRMVQGAYFQWLNREHPEADSVINLIRIIADNTLAYRKRYAYIKKDMFRLGHNTVWAHTQKAIELGLLESKKTRYYTMYRLVLSEEIENNTAWIKDGAEPKIKQKAVKRNKATQDLYDSFTKESK